VAGVRRVVRLSAVGVDRETPTEFSRTKLAGDNALMERDLDWVILRPSVVIGHAAYGGSALIRGLAALPVQPVMAGTGPLQIVALDDVVDTVVFFLRPDAPSRQVFPAFLAVVRIRLSGFWIRACDFLAYDRAAATAYLAGILTWLC
jgi:uncharacterized protein YbjT (DUF2867 family)